MRVQHLLLSGITTILFSLTETVSGAKELETDVLHSQIKAANSIVKPDIIKHNQPFDEKTSPGRYLATKSNISKECSKSVNVIYNQNDMSVISHCEVVDGSILIKEFYEPLLDLGDIALIRGDLIVQNATELQRIQGDGLQSISGKMDLQELTSLVSMRFPSLNSVNSIEWRVLPILSSVNFESGLSQVETIIISDTALSEFSGFEVETLKTLNINNNRYLEKINSGVRKITEELSIASNAQSVAVKLPSLGWANNITIRGVASLELSVLEEVESSLGFIDNGFEVVKVPKLASVGGTLIISENDYLKEVEFPNLEEVEGGLMIFKNPNLAKMSFFPKLSVIGGAIKVEGDFKDLTFPKLKLVKGSASLKTSSGSFNCGNWIRTEASVFVRGGKIECSANSRSSETIHIDNNGVISGGGTSTERNGIDLVSGGVTSYGVPCVGVIGAIATFLLVTV